MMKRSELVNALACPDCGSENVVEIIFGMVTAEYFEMEKRGEIVLAGCGPIPETHCCKNCEKWFEHIE